MVIGAKDVRSIKVSNLPENISNDVLRFLFKESTSVIRTPHSTTAIVEFTCIRDVAAYIHKDKTLMVEDKVLTIEGCSSKSEGTSNKDPLESRQLYIENIPRWVTTEYLDVLFPGAKSIKRIDRFTAVAEYRSAKDSQMEFVKTKTLRIDQNQLVVVPAKDYRRNTSNDGSPVQNVGRYSSTRRGRGYQSSFGGKPGFGNERSNPNTSSGGTGGYYSHKRHMASGSQNQGDHSSANSLATSTQDQLLSRNSTQADLLGLPQAFGKSNKIFSWKKPGAHQYSNVRGGRRRGAGRNAGVKDGGGAAEGNECGGNDDNGGGGGGAGDHDRDGDGDVEKSRIEAKNSGQLQQQKRAAAAAVVGQNQKESKTHQVSPVVGSTQKEAKVNQTAATSSQNQETKVTQRSSATASAEGAKPNPKEAKGTQKSAETSQNQTEAKPNQRVPSASKEKSVSSRRESSVAHSSNSGTSKTDRAQISTSKPVRDRSPHKDCPNKRMRTTYESSTRTGSSRGHSKTSRETAASLSLNHSSKGRRRDDTQQDQGAAPATPKQDDSSVTSSVSNLLNKLDMLAALSQFAKDYEDAYQTTQKGSQEKSHKNDKEREAAPVGSSNSTESKNRVVDRTGSSRGRHRGDSSDCANKGTSYDQGPSDSSRARRRGEGRAGDRRCDSANRRSTTRSHSSSHSTSWMSEPRSDGLRDHHRHHRQSTSTTGIRSTRSRSRPCYGLSDDDGGGGVGRRNFLEKGSGERYQSRGHYHHHGDELNDDHHHHHREERNGLRFWSENDSGRSRSYASADVDFMRSSEVRGRNFEDRGSSQSGSERKVWISGRLDSRNSGQGRSYQQREFHYSDGSYKRTVYQSNPDLSCWDEVEYDGGSRRSWEREEEEGHNRTSQRFSETSRSYGHGDVYDNYDYDCYDDDGGGDNGGRRAGFDRQHSRNGKWTEDRWDMYEGQRTNEDPFSAVHLTTGSDRLEFGERERQDEEEVERDGRFRREGSERRYNYQDLNNEYRPHGNRRPTTSSSSSAAHNNNMSRSHPQDYYDGCNHRPSPLDNRRATSINPSESEQPDYEGDGTRHRGKRQSMNPRPYVPDARTFRKGGDLGITANRSSGCRGDKEWSVDSRGAEERTVFLTNSVKRGVENCGRVNNMSDGRCGVDDVGKLGVSERWRTGKFDADESHETADRFGSNVRCESGRFVGAEDRCKVGRFGSDGWSEEGGRFGVNEGYSPGRFGPTNDERCNAGRFGADGSYEAGRFDVDERCMVGRFDVDERRAADQFDSNERLTMTDGNDMEQGGSRISGCDHDLHTSGVRRQCENGGNNSLAGRKFGFGNHKETDGSATNFRVGKLPDSDSRLDCRVNNDLQDSQLSVDVDERERMHCGDGVRFNRHRGIETGNPPKTTRALEERVNNTDNGIGGDSLTRGDNETDDGNVGGYGNCSDNRDIDERVFLPYSGNHSNTIGPNSCRHENRIAGAQQGSYDRDRGSCTRGWNRLTENPNNLGLTDAPGSRDKGSSRQFNVLSDGKRPGVTGRPPSFGVCDADSRHDRDNDRGGVEFCDGISNSLIMRTNDAVKTDDIGGHGDGQYRPENLRGNGGDGNESYHDEHTFRDDNTNEETRMNNNNDDNNNNSNNSTAFSIMKHHGREFGTAPAVTPGFKADRSQPHGCGQGQGQSQSQPQGHRQSHGQQQGIQNPPHFRTERSGGGGGDGSGDGGAGGSGGFGGGGGHFADFRCPLPGMPSSLYPSTMLPSPHHHDHAHHQHPAATHIPTRASPPGLGAFQQAFAPPPAAATTAALLQTPPPPIRGLPNSPFPSSVSPNLHSHSHHPPPAVPVGVVWPLMPLPPPTTLPLVDNTFYQTPHLQ